MSGTKDEILNGGGERPKYAAPPVASELESSPQDNLPDTGNTAAGASLQAADAGKQNTAMEPAKPQAANPVAQLSDAIEGVGGKVVDSTPRKMSYKEMYQALNPYKPPTEEELEKQRKKERRQKIFAAIGDGISALSNLYFTTKGAPNMYNPNNSQQAEVKDRWDKLKQERDQHMREYTEGLMKAQALDDENDNNERKWQRLLKLDKDKADKDKAEQDRKDALADAQRGKYEAAARKDDAMTAFYQAKEDALNEGLPLDLALKKAKKAKEDAIADKNRRQGTSSWVSGKSGKGGSGGAGSGEFTAYDKDGGVHKFKTAKAAEQFARQNGTWHVDTSTTTSNVQRGHYSEVTTTTKPNGGHSVKPPTQKPHQKPKPSGGSKGAKPGNWASGLVLTPNKKK